MRVHRTLLFVLTGAGLLLAVVLVSVLLWLVRDGMDRERSRELAASARQHLRLDMSRLEVEPYMSAAWRYYDCRDSDETVYLFGSHNERLTSTLYVRYHSKEGLDFLVAIGNVDDQLQSFRRCAVYDRP